MPPPAAVVASGCGSAFHSLLTLAPHRFGGPQGVGVLYRNPRVPLAPQLHGGVQQGGLRAGTETLAAIVGAGAASALPAIEVTPLQQQLHGGLLERIEQMTLNGPEPGPDRLPTQLNYSLAGLEGEGLALALDMQGVAIASGAACVTQNLAIPPHSRRSGLTHPARATFSSPSAATPLRRTSTTCWRSSPNRSTNSAPCRQRGMRNMNLEEQIQEALKGVNYPGYSRDIVSFGLVKAWRRPTGRRALTLS